MNIKYIHKITAGLAIVAVFSSCFKDENSFGYEYMPDMYRSPAQEAYVDYGEVRTWKSNDSITHTPSAKLPPMGTIPYTGEQADVNYDLPYKRLPSNAMITSHGIVSLEYNDGDYDASATDANPMPMYKSNVETGKVLYSRFCNHCHGAKGKGDGKVANNEFINPPEDAFTKPDGQMFYSITYGKGVMGAHASQLTQKERWQVISYIKSLNGAEVLPDPKDDSEIYSHLEDDLTHLFAETPAMSQDHSMDSAHSEEGHTNADMHGMNNSSASGTAISLDNLEFELGSSVLNMAKSKKSLDILLKLMKQYNQSIVLEGNTDNTGDPIANVQLSLDRANAVKAYLVQNGIEANRVEARGLGANNPKASNETIEGKAKNRRTEVKIK